MSPGTPAITEIGRADCDIALLKLTDDGALDGTFGSSGITLVDLDREEFETAVGVEVLTDGSIVAAAMTGAGSVVLKVTATGELDTSFGDSGVVTVWDEPGTPTNVVLLPSGGIVAVGDGFEWVAVARVGFDGDLTMGAQTPWPSQCFASGIRARAINAVATESGQVVVAVDRCLAAFNPDGSLDTQFGTT